MTAFLPNWRLKDVDPGRGSTSDLASGLGEGWIDVTAPGDTYLALVEAGRLDHPFLGRNEAAAEWVRHREWWWHTRLSVESLAEHEAAELVFEGLDTFADIYLGGVKVASSDNMFRAVRLDVASLAGQEQADLAIRFHPTAAVIDPSDAPNWRRFKIFTSEGRNLVRKAQYGWGWDWGPNLPTVGVWKPVRIERRTGARIVGVNFDTLDVTDETAMVNVAVDLDVEAHVDIVLFDPDGALVASGALQGSGELSFKVESPRLWWTADLGAQPLYRLVVRTPGSPEEVRRVGIRTVTLDQSADPDEPGATFFRFVLNGVPIFARGACWIPASAFIGTVPTETYGDYVRRAAAGNMNMLRVWGGGVYEDDAFYDACDAAGILVWQDFMFACAPYPEDGDFIANVRAEAAEQVRRLRSHPCLALWCGNNEIQLLQAFENYVGGKNDRLVGLSIFDTHIPAVLQDLDPITPYWPSSPFGGPNPNSMRGGDVHNWTVWHGAAPVPDDAAIGPLMATGPDGMGYVRYAEDMSRFVSEFGIHGAANLELLRKWMAPEDLALGSEGFKDRTKDPTDKSGDMASLITGRPRTIQEFVEFTRLVQAEGLKFGIEHFRRRTPHCSGALIWQLNDAWPCVSWSLIDHEGGAKPSYFAIRRAYAPVLASFRQGEGDEVELWITNDTRDRLSDVASVALTNLDGGEDWRVEAPFEVGTNESVVAWRGQVPASVDRVLTVSSPSGVFESNRLLLATVEDLRLHPEPGLSWTVDGNRLTVSASRYALAVHVDSGDPAVDFVDNDFDLAAGETRTLVATGPITSPSATVSSWSDRKAARAAHTAKRTS